MRILALLPALLIATSGFVVSAQELPFGVSPKQITVSGSIDFDEPHTLGLSKGQLIQSYEYKVGNRTGVRLSGIEYTLRFWNVGEMGGTSGYLFWKKDFGKASLHLEYVIDTPGQIITEETETPMGPAYKMEDAEDIPAVDGVSCSLRFTGGPAGTFKGTCGNGATVGGRIGGTGAFATFEKITQPEDPKESALALSFVGGKEMRLSGEFGDWKFDASELEDSGARFSSLTGEVETRHENDPKWTFAKLGTVLYVLDHVKTGEDSQAIIGFADLSTFLVRPETEIVVTSPPKKNSKLKLVAGNIWVNVKKMVREGTMEVEMSQAIAGTRGTRFILSETGSESKIEVTEGRVAFRSKADGAEAMVSAGESIVATAAGLGAKTIFDATARDAELRVVTEAVPADGAGREEGKEETGGGSSFLFGTVVAVLVAGTALWWLRRRKGNARASL